MNAVPEPYYTLDDYFALEESGEGKHEYFQGRIFAMTGATGTHNLITANVIASLHPQLRGKKCKVYPGDLRVEVEATGLYTYPDVSVICGPLQYVGTRRDTITNPTLLVEVLSPGTESYDRGKKFQHYRALETLRDYLLIAQDATRVEHYTRRNDHQWLLTEYTTLDQSVPLDAIAGALPLAAIYEEVEFDYV